MPTANDECACPHVARESGDHRPGCVFWQELGAWEAQTQEFPSWAAKGIMELPTVSSGTPWMPVRAVVFTTRAWWQAKKRWHIMLRWQHERNGDAYEEYVGEYPSKAHAIWARNTLNEALHDTWRAGAGVKNLPRSRNAR